MKTHKTQSDLERSIYRAIMAHYNDGSLPETVIVAVSPLLDVRVIGTYGNTVRDGVANDWNTEEIDTDDLRENIASAASFYFNPCYCNTDRANTIS